MGDSTAEDIHAMTLGGGLLQVLCREQLGQIIDQLEGQSTMEKYRLVLHQILY